MNMSYCRFQNTLRDLEDCQDNIDNTDLSDEERSARDALIGMCCDIATDFGDWVGRDIVEE
jgi:hypothetical protein